MVHCMYISPVEVVTRLAYALHRDSFPSFTSLSDSEIERALVLAEKMSEQLRAEKQYRASGDRVGTPGVMQWP